MSPAHLHRSVYKLLSLVPMTNGLIFKEALSSIISHDFCLCSSKHIWGFNIKNHLLF